MVSGCWLLTKDDRRSCPKVGIEFELIPSEECGLPTWRARVEVLTISNNNKTTVKCFSSSHHHLYQHNEIYTDTTYPSVQAYHRLYGPSSIGGQ